MTDILTGNFNTFLKEALESAKRSRVHTHSKSITSSHLLLGLIMRNGTMRILMQSEFDASPAVVKDILAQQNESQVSSTEAEDEFTEGAREVLDSARVLVRQYRVEGAMVTVDHVLLALVRVNDSDFTYLLSKLHVTAEELERSAVQWIQDKVRLTSV